MASGGGANRHTKEGEHMMFETRVETPAGTLRLFASDAGLRGAMWPGQDLSPLKLGEYAEDNEHAVLAKATRELAEYFGGKRRSFAVTLDPVGTEFQKRAWLELRKVPYGETRTYGEQAKAMGRPTASRAVGAANGRNPLSVFVPCHRIVGANGALTGFAGGLEAKRLLLDLEATSLKRDH